MNPGTIMGLCVLSLSGVSQDAPPRIALVHKPASELQWKWASEQVTIDRPSAYVAMRHKLDEIYADGGTHPDLVAKQVKIWRANPGDRVLLFAAGYAHFMSLKKDRLQPRNQDILKGVFHPTATVNLEFARMQFLLNGVAGCTNDYDLQVASRILAVVPDDYDLLNFACRAMDPILPAGRATRVRYAQHLVDIAPERPGGYVALGETYYVLWVNSKLKNREFGAAAIKWSNAYLNLTHVPSESTSVAAVKQLRDQVEGQMKGE